MTASVSGHNMVVHPYRSKVISQRKPLSQRLNTIHETADAYATVAQNKKHFSPPNLPPCWGQDVAPPPTPLYTPQTSPGNSHGKHTNPSNENGHDIEIVDLPIRYDTPSEVMEPDILEPIEQIRNYRPRSYLKHQNSQEMTQKVKGSNKSLKSRYCKTSSVSTVDRHEHPVQNGPYDHRETSSTRNTANHYADEDGDDFAMLRSDDVITYSYRFGKSGEINRYPIDMVQPQPMHVIGSRTNSSNEMISKKVRRRKKRRQRIFQNLSPDELVAIDEVPYLSHYAIEDKVHFPIQTHGIVEPHGRGYFVGDTKIYDNNLNNISNVNHVYGYPQDFNSLPSSHLHGYRSYRNTLPKSHRSMKPPPNSQSNSPMYTGSSGTSPEATAHHSSHQPHPSSPVSPDSNFTSQTTNVLIVNHCHVDRNDGISPDTNDLAENFEGQMRRYNPNLLGIRSIRSSSSTSSLIQTTVHKRRSAMKMTSSSSIDRHPRKTVQWLVDTKKRPEDISQDRKVVKYQVKEKLNQTILSFMRDLNKALIFPTKLLSIACQLMVKVDLKLIEFLETIFSFLQAIAILFLQTRNQLRLLHCFLIYFLWYSRTLHKNSKA